MGGGGEGGELQKCSVSREDFISLTRRLLLILKEEELEEWAATAWSLWNARIRFLHEGFQAHPECIVEKGATLIRDYQWMQISLLRASVTASPTLN